MLLLCASYFDKNVELELIWRPFLWWGIFGSTFGGYKVLFVVLLINVLLLITGLCMFTGKLSLSLVYYFSVLSLLSLAHLLTLFVGEGDVILVFPLLNALYFDLDLYFLI